MGVGWGLGRLEVFHQSLFYKPDASVFEGEWGWGGGSQRTSFLVPRIIH